MTDDELVSGIKALTIEATRDTPRLTPQEVAALAMKERQKAAEPFYRQVPGLYRAVAEVTDEFERRQRLRLRHQRGMTWALSAVLIYLLIVIALALT